VTSFRPAPGFLRYLKLWFWLVLIIIDVLIIGAWIATFFVNVWLGLVLAIPAWAIAIIPDIIAYIAIHLRYDTTWYVMSDRSLRIRRGIWTLSEMTITFENVQNVRVEQGPVQRYYGIADVMIDTAGAAAASAGKQKSTAAGNQAVIEGIDNAHEIRDQILQRLRKSKTAGLGDEDDRRHHAPHGWSPAHLAALREIRDAAVALRL
jgi:membrane protein YdbS with pleckstrin-like domain